MNSRILLWRTALLRHILPLACVGCCTFGVVGCKTPSTILGSSQTRPEYGVAEVDKTRWTDILRPRPRLDKVDEPTWEIPDTPSNPIGVQLAYAKWMEKSGNAEAATEAYESVLKADANSVDSVLGLARINEALKRDALASQWFAKALELSPRNVDVLTAYGRFELDAGRLESAADKLAAAVEVDPDSTGARYSLAVTRTRQGRIPEARLLFIATVGEAEAHHNLGMLLKDTRPHEAMAEFRAAYEKKPSLKASQIELAGLKQVLDPGGKPYEAVVPAHHAGQRGEIETR